MNFCPARLSAFRKRHERAHYHDMLAGLDVRRIIGIDAGPQLHVRRRATLPAHRRQGIRRGDANGATNAAGRFGFLPQLARKASAQLARKRHGHGGARATNGFRNGAQGRRAGAGSTAVKLNPGEEQTDDRAFDDDAIELCTQGGLNSDDGLRQDGCHVIDPPRRIYDASVSRACPRRRVAVAPWNQRPAREGGARHRT